MQTHEAKGNNGPRENLGKMSQRVPRQLYVVADSVSAVIEWAAQVRLKPSCESGAWEIPQSVSTRIDGGARAQLQIDMEDFGA